MLLSFVAYNSNLQVFQLIVLARYLLGVPNPLLPMCSHNMYICF